jgi:alpha-beta hydrolase superfamily lysophospholipase
MSSITLMGVEELASGPTEDLFLQTDRGPIRARFHEAGEGDAAVLWVFGAGGGLGGPAGGLYPRLAEQLLERDIASVELAYRRPGDLVECMLDVLVGVAWLAGQERTRIVLVGHSFGGAVVLNAAKVAASHVIGVAALSSQTAGINGLAELAPMPLLFAHGDADDVLPDRCSRDLYELAQEPKRLIIYPGCRHGLDECREALDRDLRQWIETVVADTQALVRPS